MHFLRHLLILSSSFGPWGSDADLVVPSSICENVHYSKPSLICQGMIRFFQKKISPIDGPRSSYAPSSSQFTLLAIQKYGVLKGIALGCDRLMRENGQLWVYEIYDKCDPPLKYDPVR
ncbi:MAG: membrane protein insertion efficiency factor YidD [Chlamydiia bacterium]|nr:membrane protein insertion efficiency factor YidD [Chlamydiia bacterium]